MTMTTSAAEIDRQAFFDAVRIRPFGGSLTAEQVAGMTAVLDCWDHSGYSNPQWLAYILGTAFHETGERMIGVREVGEGRGRDYGKPAGPYEQAYYGRGMVQLTWLANYTKATAELRLLGIPVDLVKSPDDALHDDVAAAILLHGCVEGWFTGKKLSDYFAAGRSDPVNARRIVNGLDQANGIASYHFAFLAAIAAATEPVQQHTLTVSYQAPSVPSPGPVSLPQGHPNLMDRVRAWFGGKVA